MLLDPCVAHGPVKQGLGGAEAGTGAADSKGLSWQGNVLQSCVCQACLWFQVLSLPCRMEGSSLSTGVVNLSGQKLGQFINAAD